MANLAGDSKKSRDEDGCIHIPDDAYSGVDDADNVVLCNHLSVPVTAYDYKTLGDEEFINDTIIDFYLAYLHGILSKPLQESIHVFSSQFYNSLKGPNKMPNINEKGKKMTKAEKSYLKVKVWTRKVDIFSKRMLVFPICEESHWYLIVVCNHGMVLSAKHTKDYEEKREEQQKLESMGENPFIMVLDSMEGTHSSAVNKIRSFLMFEHMERTRKPRDYGSQKMSLKSPLIPLQSNYSDCGVYLLHYAELIFQNPHRFLGAKLPDLSKWFSLTEINSKRRKIADVIKSMAASQGISLKLFPKIKFPSPIEGTTDSSEGEASPVSTPRYTQSDPRTRNLNKRSSTGNVRAHTPDSQSVNGRSSQGTRNHSDETHRKKRFQLSSDPDNLQRAEEKLMKLISSQLKRRH